MKRSLALIAAAGGVLSAGRVQAQHTFEFSYGGPVVPISDGPSGCSSGCGPIASAEINVNFTAFPIQWVRVETQINHTYQGDLHLELYRVFSNQDVVLMDRPGSSASAPCGFSADNLGIDPDNTFSFDDGAAAVYDVAAVNYPGIDNVSGLWRSEHTLAVMNTYDPYGPWRLYAQDCAAGDTGAINWFDIIFNCPWGEFEPNDTKAQALNVGYYPLDDGEPVTGYTRGMDLTGNITSQDTFIVLPNTPHPPGLYRHRLNITARGNGVPVNDYTATLLGLAQRGGVIMPFEDLVGYTHPAVDEPRFLQWYETAAPGFIFFRLTGDVTTTGASYYAAAMQTDPVTPDEAGSFAPGSITITTVGLVGTDTDLWVLDSSLNPIVGYGNDDSQGTTQSTLTRSYAPGTYYLAISDFNLSTNLASPADDQYSSGAVTDYPHVLACASEGTPRDLTFRITDGLGHAVTTPAVKTGPFDVLFFRFTVAAPCYPNCDGSTTVPLLTVNDFICFQSRFAAGDVYANCDGSTTLPLLTVNDFICFQGTFAAGCP